MSFFSSLNPFSSKSHKPQKISAFDKQQQNIYGAYGQGLMGGGGPLADIFQFDPEALREMYTQAYAQPAYQQFQEEIVPGITGQFRGQGLEKSSYLGGALGKAGTDVQKNLDAQLSQMLYQAQQQAQDRKFKGVSDILNMQTFAYQQSPLMQLLNQIAGGAGKAVGAKLFG